MKRRCRFAPYLAQTRIPASSISFIFALRENVKWQIAFMFEREQNKIVKDAVYIMRVTENITALRKWNTIQYKKKKDSFYISEIIKYLKQHTK